MQYKILFSVLVFFMSFQLNECAAQTRDIPPRKKTERNRNLNKNYRISTRLGLSTLRRLSTQFEKRYNDTKGLYFNGSYVFGWSGMQSGGGLFCGNVGLQEFYSLSGFGTEVGLTLRDEDNHLRGRAKIFSLEYRYVTGNDVEDDEGCFGGSNETDYALYDLTAHQFAFLYTFEKANKSVGAPNFYISVGLGMQNKIRQYKSRGGTFSIPMPSNERTTESVPFLRFDLGIRL